MVVTAPGTVKFGDLEIAPFHRDLERLRGEAVTAPIALVAMAHVHPIRHLEWIISFAIRAENARIDIINARPKMLVKIFVKVVVPLDSRGIENGKVIGLLAVFETAHKSVALLEPVSQPNRRKMD